MRVAHKDRLCSFAYNRIRRIFKVLGAEICMEPDDVHSADQGPAKGGISVITAVGTRLYGDSSNSCKKKKLAPMLRRSPWSRTI